MRELVLIGGGHAHVEIVRRWRDTPIEDVRLTLISPDEKTPYSGMIPGVIAGIYQPDDAYIDLPPLCDAPNIRFIQQAVIAIDGVNKVITLSNKEQFNFDVASINTGATPNTALISDNHGQITPVKPIDDFYRAWEQQKRFLDTTEEEQNIYIVGGGAASCEIASTLKWQVDESNPQNAINWTVIAPKDIIPEYSDSVRKLVRDNLKKHGISVLQHYVSKAENNRIVLDDDRQLTSTWTIWALPGIPGRFIAQSDLPHNDKGELQVDEYLRVLDHPTLFGAGDCIEFNGERLRKTGVYPVRQGPILDANIRATLTNNNELTPFKPRKTLLNILLLSPNEAILSFGPLAAKGKWVLTLKDAIDRRFMQRYQP